ncbi:endonuclease [Kaistella sp. PBT33-4]|uniref:endonuclease n=1 Tax=Kaistella sp. PBT33-4 TaxID=3032000 RepID=UPI0023D81BAE|nr:endonuclease [Kaistella sp. PBT33-4]MDF0720383.1 endonuclease [Kaistella sp. PBT33-4]
MKKIVFFACFAPAVLFAQVPAGYYNGTAGLSGYALKSKVHEIISRNYNWNYADLPAYYGITDLDRYDDHGPANNDILLDIYSEIPGAPDAYEYTVSQLTGSASTEGVGYNREHIIPQSTFDSYYPMYSDLHFVVPTDARINQLRSNYPHAVGGGTTFYTFTNTSKIRSDNTPGYAYSGRVYEPVDEYKGDVARMILYFAVRYESKLRSFNYSAGSGPANDTSVLNGTAEYAFDPGYLEMLKMWHSSDPVSTRETERNNAVYSIQKNRNPFIDNPGWVDLIWSETPDALPPQAPSGLAVTATGAHFVTLTWTPSADADVLGYHVYINGNTVPFTTVKENTATIDRLTANTAYSFAVRSFDRGYLESAVTNPVSATTLYSDSFAKDLMITKFIDGSGFNNAVEISNNTGHEVNLNNYNLRIQFYNSVNGNYYFSESFQLEGKAAAGETFVVRNPRATFNCYSNEQAKFVTASDPLTFTGTQYVELAYKGNSTVDAIGTKDTFNSLGDMSLYRQYANQPNTLFNPAEWQNYPTDYCQNLGTLTVADNLVTNSEAGIYPNPVRDLLYLTDVGDKATHAQIFDLSGRLIRTLKFSNQKEKSVDVSELPSGVYFIRVNTKSFRFIKQ